MSDIVHRLRTAIVLLNAEREEAAAEIERLRAVLEEIAEGTAATWISDRVREVLGE